MSFIRRNGETAPIYKEMFGGPGETEMHRILLGADEMYGKGRLFNHVVLHPGCALGWHVHDGDSETYYILRGEGEYSDNGTLIKPEVKVGDEVIFAKYSGTPVKHQGKDYLILSERDILATIEK